MIEDLLTGFAVGMCIGDVLGTVAILLLWHWSSQAKKEAEQGHRDLLDYYTEARHYVERLARLYCILHGVKTCCLRLFSVYGPREERKGGYANLVSQFLWAVRGETGDLRRR